MTDVAVTGADQEPKSDSQRRAQKRWAIRPDSCRIAVSISIPDTTKYVPAPAVQQELLDELEGRYPELRIARRSMTVSFYSEANVPSGACMEASGLAPKLTSILGQPVSAAYNFRIAAGEAAYPVEGDERPPAQDVPPLVGVGEIAELLQVSRQRVNQLTSNPAFPAPVARLKATPVWRRVDIDRFGISRRGQQAALRPVPEDARETQH